MKLIKLICLTVLLGAFVVACKEKPKTEPSHREVSHAIVNLQKVSIGIEGMTCQIGCAKTIESKLSKTEGVTSVTVSFENKIGEFVFDANEISKEEIAQKIASIGNGELYTTTEIKEKAL